MTVAKNPWNEALIGKAGGKALIDTPALVIDLDAYETNLAAMREMANARGVGLRPHAKTHKGVTIARHQLERGAVGICCAKLGEAEALAAGGIDQILLTSTITGKNKSGRLLDLHNKLEDLALVVDDLDNVAELAALTQGQERKLRLLIDTDVGSHRFGVTSVAEGLALADAIREAPGLELIGVQGYAGQVQAIKSYAERHAGSRAALQPLLDLRDALAEAGHAIEIVTGGGTGTHDIDHQWGFMTDLQVGSYIFQDVVYDGIEQTADGTRRLTPSLFVLARVVSRRHAAFATIDAGTKSFSMDGPLPVLFEGPTPGSAYIRAGDEFGKVSLEGAARPVQLGELTAWLVPHCDPTLNFFDHYHCLRGDVIEAIWPIEARGRAD
jgi:3-hydroxy-D-aspartate aldolase